MTRKHNLMPLLLTMAVLAFLSAGTALAQTPDGETPAEESVCDTALLSGAAFGLCNAYCEAMDCHLPDAEHPDSYPKASVTACMKVKNNFIKITGESELPCEATDECPPGTPGCLDGPCIIVEGEPGCITEGLSCEGEDPGWMCVEQPGP